MNKYLRESLDFLLFSNLFIALCSMSQGLVTYQLLHQQPQKQVLGLLFCSTLLLYNFSILLIRPKEPEKSSFRRVRWIFSHYRFMLLLSALAALALIPLALYLSFPTQIVLALLGIISLAYGLPIFRSHNRRFGLRNIPGIKLILIALVWSISAVLIPILELENKQSISIPMDQTLLLLAKRFLFVAAITIPFDIRDLFQDQLHAVKTLPVMLGEKKAYLVCQFLLLVYLVLLLFFTKEFDRNFWGLALTVLLAGWLIFRSNWKKNEYYYFLYLDGTLILQFLMLMLVNVL